MALVAAPTGHAQIFGSHRPVESELVMEGGQSVGNIHVFAFSDNRSLRPMGFEYDRHCFGRLLGSEFDYVAELLPVVLLNEPAKYDKDGFALTTARQEQYGAGFTPVGLRLIWRKPGQLRPYWIGKGGILYFKNRVLSTEGTHLNYSAQFGIGVEKAVTSRLGFRLGYNDFHFSNGDTARKNPGIDFMYFNAGVTYRIGR